MKTTHTSHSSGPDDGLWTCIVGHTVYTYELSYWADLDGTTHRGKYNVQAGYVEVPVLEAPFVRSDASPCDVLAMYSALRCCGYTLDPHTGDVVNEYDGSLVCERGARRTSSAGRKQRRRWLICIAECMWGYGAKHVLYDGSGNNRRALVREALHAF